MNHTWHISGVEGWGRATGVELGEEGEAKAWGGRSPMRIPEQFKERESVQDCG